MASILATRLPAALACLLAVAGGGVFAQDSSRKDKDDPSRIGNRDVGKGINFYSLEKEMALGKQLAEEVRRQAKMVEDPLISEFVNRVGQNLVRNADAHVPFTFQVIEGDSPNAFALPGGYVFVYTGLIKVAGEEDELAAAMAHEIAHVAARHMTRQATKAQIVGVARIPAGVIFGGGIGGLILGQAARTGVPALFMQFTRQDETEADYLGVQYLYAAGYDPNGAIGIFEKLESLERRQPGTVARIYASHPMDAARIARTEREIGKILPARREYVVSTSEYAAIRERVIGSSPNKLDGEAARPRLVRREPEAGPEPERPDGPAVRRRDLVD